MVFAHRHGDARSNPSNETDGGNQPETNHRADNATAVLSENVFAGDQANLELTAYFHFRRCCQKNRIQEDVSHDDDECAGEERTRNVAFWIFYFADDVTGRVPARVG